jgi:hypothetical protein
MGRVRGVWDRYLFGGFIFHSIMLYLVFLASGKRVGGWDGRPLVELRGKQIQSSEKHPADYYPILTRVLVVSRCNNVLWISGATKSETDRADVKMEG